MPPIAPEAGSDLMKMLRPIRSKISSASGRHTLLRSATNRRAGALAAPAQLESLPQIKSDAAWIRAASCLIKDATAPSRLEKNVGCRTIDVHCHIFVTEVRGSWPGAPGRSRGGALDHARRRLVLRGFEISTHVDGNCRNDERLRNLKIRSFRWPAQPPSLFAIAT